MSNRNDGAGLGLVILSVLLVLVLLMATMGCASKPEGIRLDKSPLDTAREAACQPLPVCDIPEGANSTQLELALWGCILEYRALYSACYHLVHPPKVPPTAYGQKWCQLTDPAMCFDGEGRKL